MRGRAWLGLGALALGLSAGPALAQEARLVLREAVYENGGSGLGQPDTTGWERSVLDGQPIRLGDVLLEFGKGSVVAVAVGLDKDTSFPSIQMELSDAAARSFSDLIAARVGEAIAVVVDDRVLVAPTVISPIPNGRIEISGAFRESEVESIVRAIRKATGLPVVGHE